MKTIKRMISIFALSLINLFGSDPKSSAATSETEEEIYIVIQIEGKVVSKKTGLPLLPESKFLASDTLQFSDTTDKLIVITQKKGEAFVIAPDESLDSYEKEICEKRVGNRPGLPLNYLDIRLLLCNRRLLILEGRTEIKVGQRQFPQDNLHYFYVRYSWKGDKGGLINKKLPFIENRFILSKNELFKVDGQPIRLKDATELQLFYYKQSKQESLFICDLELVIPDEAKLKSEVRIIIEQLGVEHKDLFDTIDSYLLEAYGEAEISDLMKWLNNAFGLKIER